MGELVATLLSEIVDDFGFDVDQAAALRALNRAHRTMVRRSRMRKGTASLGVTVAGTSDYALDGTGVLELLDLTVGDIPYNRAPRRAQQAYARGTLLWEPSLEGLFVDTADGAGAGQVGLIPAPTDDGLAIVAYGALDAEELAIGGAVLVPEDYSDALVGRAAARFYRTEPEQADTARELEAMFDAACEELRRATAKQKRGAGPATIRLER